MMGQVQIAVALMVTMLSTVPVLAQSFSAGSGSGQIKIDRAKFGVKYGIMTSAKAGVLTIDGDRYELLPAALVEDRFGTPIGPHMYELQNVECSVQFWTGVDRHKITQIMITFPE